MTYTPLLDATTGPEQDAVPIPADVLERFVSLLPAEARTAFPPDDPAGDFGSVVDRIRDHMHEYVYRCQRRPGLPHEREEHGPGGFYLTKKGTERYRTHLQAVADAFEEAFGVSVDRIGSTTPVGGRLDPLTYD